ncbi:hypothetical protein GJ496_010288 [Pomphorhynchus laevis]|nr:hypothetical protein GJ496_010288 [Pomphorhynchus laevis]
MTVKNEHDSTNFKFLESTNIIENEPAEQPYKNVWGSCLDYPWIVSGGSRIKFKDTKIKCYNCRKRGTCLFGRPWIKAFGLPWPENVAFQGTKAAGKIRMLKDKETSNSEDKAFLADYAHLFNNKDDPTNHYYTYSERINNYRINQRGLNLLVNTLSRLPMKEEVNKENVDVERVHILLDHDAVNIGFSADELHTASLIDPVIHRVRRYLESAFPNECEDQLQPYAARKKNELLSENRMII